MWRFLSATEETTDSIFPSDSSHVGNNSNKGQNSMVLTQDVLTFDSESESSGSSHHSQTNESDDDDSIFNEYELHLSKEEMDDIFEDSPKGNESESESENKMNDTEQFKNTGEGRSAFELAPGSKPEKVLPPPPSKMEPRRVSFIPPVSFMPAPARTPASSMAPPSGLWSESTLQQILAPTFEYPAPSDLRINPPPLAPTTNQNTGSGNPYVQKYPNKYDNQRAPISTFAYNTSSRMGGSGNENQKRARARVCDTILESMRHDGDKAYYEVIRMIWPENPSEELYEKIADLFIEHIRVKGNSLGISGSSPGSSSIPSNDARTLFVERGSNFSRGLDAHINLPKVSTPFLNFALPILGMQQSMFERNEGSDDAFKAFWDAENRSSSG